MDEEVLITLVANYKELYDLQHPYYDDSQRRNNVWEEIGGILKQPGTECRNRWRRIRDNYRRAKKLRKTKGKQGAKNMKNPKYDKILSFLIPYIDNETETKCSLLPLDSSSNTNVTDSEDDNYRASSTPTSALVEDTPVIPAKKICTYKVHKRRSTPDFVAPSATHTLVPNYVEKKYSSQKEPDRVSAFFANLGQTVNTFPENIQIRVKREVFRIVSEAEEEVYLRKQFMDGNTSAHNPDV